MDSRKVRKPIKGEKRKFVEVEVEEDEVEIHTIEKIVKKRIAPGGRIEYYVKWWGWDSADNTWEPRKRLLVDCPKAVVEFENELAGITSQQNDDVSDGDVYEVEPEAILGRRKNKMGKIEYLIKWEERDHSFNTWEPVDKMGEYVHMIKAYETQHPEPGHTEKSKRKLKDCGCSRQSNVNSKTKSLKEPEPPSKSSDVKEVRLPKKHKASERAKNKNGKGVDITSTDEVPTPSYRPNDIVSGPSTTVRTGWEENLEAEMILGATQVGGLAFLIKWKDLEEADLIPMSVVRCRWPQLLIEFYEERVTWTG